MLLGTPHLYYDLYQYDEEFERLFKVKAEFASEMARTPENEQAYALFVRARCQEHNLPPFDASAVAHIIDQARGWLKIKPACPRNSALRPI
jgi:predicted ATP-dependent protease